MQPDWDYVKRTTLWHYEELIKKLDAVTAYPIIWKSYNHDITQAGVFARSMFPDRNIEAGEFPASIISTIEVLKSKQVSNWGDLISLIPDREDCSKFVAEQKLRFEEFIDLLNFLLRWAFPFRTSSRELVDHDNSQEMSWYEVLKQHELSISFVLLDMGHTLEGRDRLVKSTCLSLDVVTKLVHRADIARLPYVRRKTILPVCGAGYDTLAKIANANLPQMDSDMESYMQSMLGKSWDNYKSVIILKLMIPWAKALPVIVED